jgi:ethylmalonyl-CoA mutase
MLKVDDAAETRQIELLERWRSSRDHAAVKAALEELRQAAESDENLMPASIAAAKAGATTGEWSQVLREVFGEYRGPTGVGEQALASGGALSSALEDARRRVRAVEEQLGRRLRSWSAGPVWTGTPTWPSARSPWG